MTTTLQQSIAQSIIDRSTSYGDRIAVGDEITELSYKTLIGRAAALSRTIEDLQLPDLPIGIFLPNAASYLVAILALLLAGRTSVPLDTAHPDERNGRIVGSRPVGSRHRRSRYRGGDASDGAEPATDRRCGRGNERRAAVRRRVIAGADLHDQLHIRHHGFAQKAFASPSNR